MTTTALRIQAPTLILIACVAVSAPLVMGSSFWLGNAALFAIFSLFSLSIGMSWGQAGILSCATGAFAAIGGYASAIVTTRYGVSPYLGLILAIVVPTVVAYPLARVVTRLSPLPLSIATLVLGSIIEIAIREGGNFTGGYVGLSGIPPIPIAASPVAAFFFSWACVAVVVFLYCNLIHSGFGRAVSTARHDALRAVADGVNVPRALAVFFAVSAAVAGLGGWLYAHDISYLAPESLATDTSLQVLLMAIVGGVRTPLGPVVGACVLLTVATYLPAAQSQGMVYGGALVVILLLAPHGLIRPGQWSALWRRLSEMARGRVPTRGKVSDTIAVRKPQ